MTDTIFLEIVLTNSDASFEGRDEIEDPLDEALQENNLGEVTGGGSGIGMSNIDVEVTDLGKGLELIKKVLQKLGVPRSTVINQYKPIKTVYNVYD